MPGRPRSYRTLAFHLFRVVDAFVGANQGTTLVQEMFREEPAPDADTAALVAWGEQVRARFRDWWQAGDTAPSKPLPTYYGPQTLHELLERTTWHCGQHVRQYMMLLEKEGVAHAAPLGAGRLRQAADAAERVGRLTTAGTFPGPWRSLADTRPPPTSPGSYPMRNSAKHEARTSPTKSPCCGPARRPGRERQGHRQHPASSAAARLSRRR